MTRDAIQRTGRSLLITEWLNDGFGFFYTARRRLFRGRSKHQRIDVVDSDEFGPTLLLDNITQVVSKNDYLYHEPMVHPAMCCHPRPRDVLVIGGGDGGVLREVLKYRGVRRVSLVELDAEVVEFSARYLRGINRGAFRDPRVDLVIGDGREFVGRNTGRFDVVIMDMTDPFGPSKMLYTKEFFTAVKRAFRDRRGVFVMHGESPVVRPVAHNCVRKTLKAVFAHVCPLYLYVQMYAVLWSVMVCSDTVNIRMKTQGAVERRLRASGIRGLKVYTGATHHAMQVVYPYLEDVYRGPGRVITDRRPAFSDNIHSSRR